MIELRQMVRISLTEDRLWIVLMPQEGDNAVRLLASDFASARLARPTVANCEGRAGNSIGKLKLMIDLFRRGTKHLRSSIAPIHVDGA
jgi:hypothetical protein